jgi:hypothetical protein
MNVDDAISRLSRALSLLSVEPFDKDEVRSLVRGLADEKHSAFIESGLLSNNRALVIRGIMGALSHYEAEKTKNLK